MRSGYKYFEVIEKHAVVLGFGIAFMVALGGLAEITPLFMQANAARPAPGIEPYDALRLAGRDVYVREGCYVCHSQMVRTLSFETQRYGDYSTAGESIYDRPFQWGSKRTGPDLARIGGKYTDEWHRLHLIAPRDLVPESNMPNYPWLETSTIDADDIRARMSSLKRLGDPYDETDIKLALTVLDGKSELDALVAYLQGLGIRSASVNADAASIPEEGSQP